jgi:hypothetical protein
MTATIGPSVTRALPVMNSPLGPSCGDFVDGTDAPGGGLFDHRFAEALRLLAR